MARQQSNHKPLTPAGVRRGNFSRGTFGLQPPKLNTMQRKIRRLERTLAQREQEVWTLKQLLLYR